MGGCVETLSGLFSSFSAQVSRNDVARVHNYLLGLVDAEYHHKRRYSRRSAMEFVAEHAQVFGPLLLPCHQKWFQSLKVFALHPNAEDSKRGTEALIAVIEEIARQLRLHENNSNKSEILEVANIAC